MARRSKSKQKNKSHLAVYLIIAAAVIGALAAGKMMLDKRAQHFAGLSELSVADFQQNANSLSGNEYRLTGKITETLKWTPDQGQLIWVSSSQEDNGNSAIPVKIPANIKKINLERGHTYTFRVEINREGLPVALEVKAK
ncbi:hypothetical protein HW115_11525 [Verrucomicrobiaceae bacterium N1E253]|uniref:Uncharacterized protein n=1 Tax=Oceaniferula marina TaxID=2748318 RepID=A0A851GFD8_9BACT|nr:hypothetical protein [Oceaniferula marina]NWK56243.1 hypothetical protein [Oceaniferula marina]